MPLISALGSLAGMKRAGAVRLRLFVLPLRARTRKPPYLQLPLPPLSLLRSESLSSKSTSESLSSLSVVYVCCNFVDGEPLVVQGLAHGLSPGVDAHLRVEVGQVAFDRTL